MGVLQTTVLLPRGCAIAQASCEAYIDGHGTNLAGQKPGRNDPCFATAAAWKSELVSGHYLERRLRGARAGLDIGGCQMSAKTLA